MGHLFFLPGRLRVTAPHGQHRNAACQTQACQREHRQRMASCPFANHAVGIHHHRAANQVGDRPDGASPAAAEVLLIQPDASAQKGPFIA